MSNVKLTRRSPFNAGAEDSEGLVAVVAEEPAPTSPSGGSGPGGSEKVAWGPTAFAFIFPAIGGLLFGWDIGVTSGALSSLTDAARSGVEWYQLTPFQSGLVVSGSLGGALIASFLAAVYVGDALGSRKELILGSIFYGTGALIQGSAPSLPILVFGRAVYGLGIGFAMHGAPVYIAETAPSKVRGLLISLKEGFIVGGILVGYLVSYAVVDQEAGWRTLLSSSVYLAVPLTVGMSYLPNTPRWLLQAGKSAHEARDALSRLRGRDTSPAVVAAEVDAMAAAADKSGVGGMGELLRPENRRPLYIGLSVVLFQQITGQPSVLYYAEQVFRDAGFEQADSAAGVAVVLGLFKLLMTGVAVAKVDSLGRRPLLLSGVTVMTLSTIVLGACTGNTGDDPNVARLSVAAIFAYVGAYQVSFGPIAWLLVGEIFPQRVRNAAVGTATSTNFLSNFLVSLYLPTLISTFGASGTYYLFSTMGVVSLVSIYYTVIETRGKTLEEIEEEMTRK